MLFRSRLEADAVRNAFRRGIAGNQKIFAKRAGRFRKIVCHILLLFILRSTVSAGGGFIDKKSFVRKNCTIFAYKTQNSARRIFFADLRQSCENCRADERNSNTYKVFFFPFIPIQAFLQVCKLRCRDKILLSALLSKDCALPPLHLPDTTKPPPEGKAGVSERRRRTHEKVVVINLQLNCNRFDTECQGFSVKKL